MLVVGTVVDVIEYTIQSISRYTSSSSSGGSGGQGGRGGGDCGSGGGGQPSSQSCQYMLSSCACYLSCSIRVEQKVSWIDVKMEVQRWIKPIIDRHHCLKSGHISKTEGGQILPHLCNIFLTSL